MRDAPEQFSDEQDELNEREGYETPELVAETEEDAILESTIESNLMEAEAQFAKGEFSGRTMAFALGTIVLLKNNILRKYNPEREKGDTKELTITENIAEHLMEDPLWHLRSLNNYIFPILKSKYKFGLRYKKLQPWQKERIIKVVESPQS